MPKTLTPELKAALAELLEEEDDAVEDDATEEAVEEAEVDEFVYRGKRYVYTPDDVAEVKETVKKPAKKATKKVVETTEEVDGEPEEEAPAPAARRRFVT